MYRTYKIDFNLDNKEEHKVRIFVKDKLLSRISKNLMIEKNYLSDDEYAFLVDSCHYLLLGYNAERYKHRVSGVYYDAITFLKPIIYSESLFFLDQNERFGDIGIRLVDNFKKVIDECLHADYAQIIENIKKVNRFYQDEMVLEDYKEIICK